MKIPANIQEHFERETAGIEYGAVTINAIFRAGKVRFSLEKNLSVYATDDLSVDPAFLYKEENRKRGRKN